MNNKGQSLFLFVLFIPIIILGLILIFDYSYITINKNKLNSIGYSSIKYLVKDNKTTEEVEKIILLNDNNIKIIDITQNTVHLKYNIDPVFGTFINKNKYVLEINLTGYIENDKLIVKEKG